MKIKFELALTFLLATLFLACSGYHRPADCSQLKTGDFIFRLHRPNAPTFYISRNDSIQTEIDIDRHDTTTLTIHWSDPCTYELKMIKTTARMTDSQQAIRANTVVTTK